MTERMSDEKRNRYEGLFLFGQSVASDLGAVVEHVRDMLERAGGEIIAMKKWDERRLAYPIKKHKRGMYLLVYFSAAPKALAAIERSSNLSELVLRSMIIRADHLTDEEIHAADGRQELADEVNLRGGESETAKTETEQTQTV